MVITVATVLSGLLPGYSQHSYFLKKSIKVYFLPSSHMNPWSRGASTLCQIYPNHHSSPPWLFSSSPRLPSRLSGVQDSHTHRGGKTRNHLLTPCKLGLRQMELAVVNPNLSQRLRELQEHRERASFPGRGDVGAALSCSHSLSVPFSTSLGGKAAAPVSISQSSDLAR